MNETVEQVVTKIAARHFGACAFCEIDAQELISLLSDPEVLELVPGVKELREEIREREEVRISHVNVINEQKQRIASLEQQLAEGEEAVAWQAQWANGGEWRNIGLPQATEFQALELLIESKAMQKRAIPLFFHPQAQPSIVEAESTESIARRIVDLVMFDLSVRKGILDEVDDGVKDEMAEELSDQIVELLSAAPAAQKEVGK